MDSNITLYKQRLNLQDAIFEKIDHADGMVAAVYRVTQPTQRQFVLKICKARHYFREVYFLNYFASCLPVPRIIKTVEPTDVADGAILMEYVEGILFSQTDPSCELMYDAGSHLARIHSNRAAGYGDLLKPASLSSDPRIYFALKFKEALAECTDHLPAMLLEQCRHYLEKHLDLLLEVDGPCITHRDFRRGNIIAHYGRVNGIIDWSGAGSGFAQEDFCFLEHVARPIPAASKKSFFAGYASIRQIPKYDHIMPLIWLNRALAIIGYTYKQDTWHGIHAQVYQDNRKALDMFFK